MVKHLILQFSWFIIISRTSEFHNKKYFCEQSMRLIRIHNKYMKITIFLKNIFKS